MSYFDSLSQWQNTATQINQHQQDVEQEANDSKARSIEQKFDHVERTMADSSGALMGFGGGLHIARKVYKKIRGVQDKVNDLKQKAQEVKEKINNNTETTPQEETDKPNGMEDDPSSSLEDVKSVEQSSVPETSFDERGATTINPEPEPEPEPTEAPAPASSESGLRIVGDENNLRLGNVADEAEQNVRSATDTGSQVVGDSLNSVKSGGQAVLDQTASSVSAVGDKVNGVVSNSSDLVSSISDTAEKIGTTALDTGTSAIMDSVGAGLDFLGPAGELLGAGLALGSFFHDIFGGKSRDKKEEEAENEPTNVQQTTGISTSSIASASTQSNVVGTIV